MRKAVFFLVAFLSAGVLLNAQIMQPLKKVLELKMPKTADDEMPGTRGATVTWHPIQKKYYAAFAGNFEYPLAVFDIKGKLLSSEDLTTMIDTRGLWYNPTTKSIDGNGHKEGGWFSYTLDKTGIPSDANVKKEGMNQPDAQSVGVYNPGSKQVLFLSLGQVYIYNSDAEPVDSVAIHWGRKKADGPGDDEDIMESNEDYNSTTVIYTGIKGQELGVLNISDKQIELYDIKTGFLTKVLRLPSAAVVESIFNFAYANGIYWLFDMEERVWIGYK